MAVYGLNLYYKDFHALKNIDLEFPTNQVTALIGPSGCGKSTLLRIIAGLEPATTGKVLVDGEDVTGAEPAERGIAMVFQSYALYPHMTVFDNIAFPLRV